MQLLKIQTLWKRCLLLVMLGVALVVSMPATAIASSINTGDCSNSFRKEECGITNILTIVIQILSGLVGVVVVAMIVLGGIQYASARDNPQAVSAAKQRIINAVLALVFYFCIFAFLQWLVPGGIV